MKMKTGAKAVLGSAAVEDTTRNAKQVCNDGCAVTQMESVSYHIRDGGQEVHLQ